MCFLDLFIWFREATDPIVKLGSSEPTLGTGYGLVVEGLKRRMGQTTRHLKRSASPESAGGVSTEP